MQIHQLQRKHKNTKRMIVARGGKRGKTAGRGGKGQSARAGNKRRPEWRDIIKRLPKLRGRGVSPFKSFVEKPVVINLEVLENIFAANDAITPTILVEKSLVATHSGRVPAIKILGDGEITKAFKLSGLYVSGSAKEKIEKAGGSVSEIVEKVIAKPIKIKKVKEPKIAQAAEPKPVNTEKKVIEKRTGKAETKVTGEKPIKQEKKEIEKKSIKSEK